MTRKPPRTISVAPPRAHARFGLSSLPSASAARTSDTVTPPYSARVSVSGSSRPMEAAARAMSGKTVVSRGRSPTGT